MQNVNAMRMAVQMTMQKLWALSYFRRSMLRPWYIQINLWVEKLDSIDHIKKSTKQAVAELGQALVKLVVIVEA